MRDALRVGSAWIINLIGDQPETGTGDRRVGRAEVRRICGVRRLGAGLRSDALPNGERFEY